MPRSGRVSFRQSRPPSSRASSRRAAASAAEAGSVGAVHELEDFLTSAAVQRTVQKTRQPELLEGAVALHEQRSGFMNLGENMWHGGDQLNKPAQRSDH